MPPATEAPYRRWRPLARASCRSSGPASDQLLVGGDDRLAGFQGAANPLTCGLEAADKFGDDIDAGIQYDFKILGPLNPVLNPVRTLAIHVAIEDVRELQVLGITRG